MKRETMQAQVSFDDWLLRKNRLEKGIDLLKKVEVEHDDDVSDLFLASITIESSMRNLTIAQTKTQAKSMKVVLKEWLKSKNYSFRNITLSETEYKTVKHLCAVPQEYGTSDGTYILPICSYCNSNEKTDNVQKYMNQIYINEFNRRWSHARNTLHKKCLYDLVPPIAEPKASVAHFQAQISDGYKEHKSSHKESKVLNVVDDKSKYEKKFSQVSILTPEFYRVSSQRFQAYLSFGINMMERIVERSERRALEKIAQEKRCRDLERDKLREYLMLKSSHKKMTRESSLRICKEPRQVLQSNQNVVQDEEKEVNHFALNIMSNLIYFLSYPFYFPQKKPLYEIIARPSVPKLWLEEDEGSSSHNVVLKWDSEERDIAYFILSSSGLTMWTDPDKDKNTVELNRKLCLKHGYEYHFGAKVVLLNGQESEEKMLRVTTSPPIPEAPNLLRSTHSSLELKWIVEENEECIGKNGSYCKYLNGTRLNRKFIIQLYDKGEWVDSSIGSEKRTALIVGLRPDTSYQVRVKCRVEGHPDVEGQWSFMCTKQFLPSKPDVMRHELSASSVSLEWKTPKNRHEDSTFDEVRKIFNDHLTESKGYINTEELQDVLLTLGSKSVHEIILDRDIGLEEKNDLGDIIMKWTNCIISILLMRKLAVDGQSSPWSEVYRGYGNKVKISNLDADTEYAFKICHLTLRSKGGFSDIVLARTLPSCPGALKLISVDSTRLDAKVDKPIGSKCLLQIKEVSRNRDSETLWETVYQGKSEHIHIPFLRSKTKYDIQCFLLNKEGRKGRSIRNKFTTSDTPIAFNDNTIPDLFQISTTADNLVVGDLILLNESLDADSIHYESGIFEYTWITRVLCTGEIVDMEIVFDYFDSRTHGQRIQRNQNQMNEYEILRMKWIDEIARR